MRGTVTARRHVLAFRLLLLLTLAVPSLHCGDDQSTPSCGGCDCLDTPDDDDAVDDDDSGLTGDDDDVIDDDDSGPDDDDSAPDDVTLGLPACEGSVLAAFTAAEIDPPSAGSDAYLVPGDDTLEAITASVEMLIVQEAPGLARAQVGLVGYELCRGEGDEAGTALWRPMEPGSGRAQFAWRAVGAEPLIVGVPHPGYDLQTLPEGVAVFDLLQARVLIAAGTHRCANVAASPCDGTTSVCGEDDVPYRESDMAHATETVFQVAHELFSDLFEDDLVVNLHGMGGAGISVSNGTTDPTDGDSVEARLALALEQAFPGEDVTTCNDFDGGSHDERLCGATNVQGRYVNGSSDACDQAASSASHRFVHLEQSQAVRSQPDVVAEAIGSVLP
jgi:hypothetical protein